MIARWSLCPITLAQLLAWLNIRLKNARRELLVTDAIAFVCIFYLSPSSPKDSRYLAGSVLVKSEIVVPIFVKNKLAAELDIEGYFEDTFTKSEQEFVEASARLVGPHLSKG